MAPPENQKLGYLNDDFRLFHLTGTEKLEISFHYHDFDKIIIFLSGDVTYHIEGCSYQLQPYDIVLVGHHEIHRPSVREAVPYDRIIVYLSPGFLDTLRTTQYDLSQCFLQAKKARSHLLRVEDGEGRGLFYTIRKLEEAGSSDEYAAPLYCRVLFLEFLIQLNRCALGSHLNFPGSPNTDRRILSVMSYIRSHLSESFHVDDLAARFHFSRYYLMRLFKQETGCTLGRYITSKRLAAAKEYMEGELSLTEICYRCGFQNYSAFSRAYKAQFGEAPRKTRAQAQKRQGGELSEFSEKTQ